MKRLVIADITSLNKNGQVFGHFDKVARMYKSILKKEFEVVIAGGPIYSTIDLDTIMLKYDNDVSLMNTIVQRMIVKLKEVLNGILLLKQKNNDIIIFQAYSIKSILIALFFLKDKKDIYLIQYKNELNSKITRALYKLVNKKITGIICPNESVGISYNKRYLVVPDYICTQDIVIETNDKKYDLGMFGIMSEGKDVEDIVNTFKNTNYKIMIAGYFSDISRYNELVNKKSENIQIINKYLSDTEYNEYIKNSKYVILPYKDYYKSATSGVIFDVLFNYVPVITKAYDTFKIIKDYDIGILYNSTLKEIEEKNILDEKLYNNYISNIKKFINENKSQANKVINFLKL